MKDFLLANVAVIWADTPKSAKTHKHWHSFPLLFYDNGHQKAIQIILFLYTSHRYNSRAGFNRNFFHEENCYSYFVSVKKIRTEIVLKSPKIHCMAFKDAGDSWLGKTQNKL